jgi:hypothetical protein
VSRKIAGKKTRFCCPGGTAAVNGDECCPPNDPDCCQLVPLTPEGDDDLVPLDPYRGPTFCVNGKPKKLAR